MAITLVFSCDNPSNTTIHRDNAAQTLLYTAKTILEGKKTVTVIYNHHNVVLARLEWHESMSDIVQLGDTKPRRMTSWMRPSVIPFVR